jgi:integration host factor subunit alpha
MVDKTLTRMDLCEAVYQKVGLSRNESSRLVESVLEEITAAAEMGENIKLSGFGTFEVRVKNERIGRNPKTGEEATITPRRVLVFKASNLLKGRMTKKS